MQSFPFLFRQALKSFPTDTVRLALVSMPWAIFNRPSIQLGTLQSYLRDQDPTIDVATCHPYLGAAKKIGLESYRIISENTWAGEAIYSSLLFPEMKEEAQDVFYLSFGRKTASLLPDFETLCDQLDNHLNKWLESCDFSLSNLIGFTVCFGQLQASLLAARRLKQKYKNIQIVFGGSTCAPEIGISLLKTFPEIDFIVKGEGEQPLLDLCRCIQGRINKPGPGILSRHKSSSEPLLSGENEIEDLNTLPPPDYNSYFTELKQYSLDFIPQLPLEFSRGCWWNKCAFCNLNLQWCGYRFKKSKRMQDEVEGMIKTYRSLDFAFTDNALPPAEADDFFRAMQGSGSEVRFFAEIRTTNKPEQYTRYRQGGLDSVQIGIEAFSNSLLRKMNKGVTVMDNLAAMKYCIEAGIILDGNLILEFPGSTKEEVEETLRALDFAEPFRPLTGATFFLGHGSPVWNKPGKYGIKSIRHHPYNRKLFPGHILNQLELLIKQGAGDRKHQKKLWRPVRKKIQDWSDFHATRKGAIPALSYRDGGDFLIIRQEQPGHPTQHHRLAGTSRKIYLACSTPVATKSLLSAFNSVTEKALKVFLGDLESKKLLFRDNKLCLALAVRRNN